MIEGSMYYTAPVRNFGWTNPVNIETAPNTEETGDIQAGHEDDDDNERC